MERNTAIIITVVSAILCGCPGLAILCTGSMSTLGGLSDGVDDPRVAIAMGLAFLCLGLIMVAIPVAVGVFTLRPKAGEAAPAAPPAPDEPLPPAI